MSIAALRQAYHARICQEVIRIRRGKLDRKGTAIEYPNFADGDNRSSISIAWAIVKLFNCLPNYEGLTEQTAGDRFELITKEFLEKGFELIEHLRPGEWHFSTIQTAISSFDQYEHLAHVAAAIKQDKELSSALGGNYIVTPDIIVSRASVSDDEINRLGQVVAKEDPVAALTPLRRVNRATIHLILHASISCKWTIRSDRAQNTRTEALNLIRNRKGNLPHIVAVTAEPLPTRIAALALGTGDLDCVYHFALSELLTATQMVKNEDQLDMLTMLIDGRRLRDISDLPFDLAI